VPSPATVSVPPGRKQDYVCTFATSSCPLCFLLRQPLARLSQSTECVSATFRGITGSKPSHTIIRYVILRCNVDTCLLCLWETTRNSYRPTLIAALPKNIRIAVLERRIHRGGTDLRLGQLDFIRGHYIGLDSEYSALPPAKQSKVNKYHKVLNTNFDDRQQ
jgi:hypothetical protein